MNKSFYSIDAFIDISTLLPTTPNTPFDIHVFLNKSNNLDYLNLPSPQSYTQFHTINSNSTLTDITITSNPSIQSSNYLSGVNLDQVQLSLTNSLDIYIEERLKCYYGENNLTTCDIDQNGSYAYFATSNFVDTTSRIFKVDLISFSIVNTLTTPYEYNTTNFIIIHPSGKDMYVSCSVGFSQSLLFRIDLETFTFVSSISFTDNLITAVMDQTGQYMYAATNSLTPVNVLKINLVTFTITQVLTLNPGEQIAYSSMIDTLDKYLYVGLNTNSVVKIDLTTFTRVSALSLSSSVVISGLIDPSGLYLYLTTISPAKFLRINLSTFTEGSSLSLSSISVCGSMDPLGKYAYIIGNNPGTVVQVNLSTFTITSTYNIPSSSNVRCASIDPAGQFLYLGQNTSPGYIQKIQLQPSPVLNNTLEGRQGNLRFIGGVADPVGQYAYVGNSLFQGVVKFSLPKWSIVNDDLGIPASVIIMDPNGKYAYFNSTKVDLSTDTAVGSVFISPIYSAIIDPSGQYAYYGTNNSIVKVDLKTMTITNTLPLLTDEGTPNCSLMDLTGTYAYFAVNVLNIPPPPIYSRIIQVDLATFTRKAQINLNVNEVNVSCVIIDRQGIFGYFGCQTSAAQLIRVYLNPLCRITSISLFTSGIRYLKCAVRDPTNSYAYFGTFNTTLIIPPPAEYIVKIDLELLKVVQIYNFDTQGISTAFTTLNTPYVYFCTTDGYIIRIPSIDEYLVSGLSGNTPGNLVNNTTTVDIDLKSQNLKLQRNQQVLMNHYFKLRVKGQTNSEISDTPLAIHARLKILPKYMNG
jgi:hypothetical protein